MSTVKIIRHNVVVAITGISGSTISRLEKLGRFPQRRKIGSRSVGWIEKEVVEWIESRGQVNKPQTLQSFGVDK